MQNINNERYPFHLPKLPYDKVDLSPYISPKTIDYHYGKHHKAYIDKLNGFLSDNPILQTQTLEQIVKSTSTDITQKGIFNQAAQVWNHTFYWNSLKPEGGKNVPLEILSLIGDWHEFVSEYEKIALSQFGSGWVWIVYSSGKIFVKSTSNAETPLINKDECPLLVCDVWEHAYYIDYLNDRKTYVNAVLNNLFNWDFALQNYRCFKSK